MIFESFLKWILDLRKELNIPHKLSEVVDTKKIDLDQLSEMAFNDPSTSGNPVKLKKEDFNFWKKNQRYMLQATKVWLDRQ